MTDWLKWTAPVAVVMSIAAPAHAIQYMSVEEAQKHAFPNATFRGGPGRPGLEGADGGGYFYYDHVVGKHLLIDYTVAIGPDGRVRRVDILNYRESYGGEVHDAELAGAIRRQEQPERGAGQQRHPQHFRCHAVVDPPGRRREEGFGLSCQSLPLVSGGRGRCLARSWRSTSPTRTQRDAEGAVEAAFAVVAEVHRLMSFHEADSDVSRLNRAASSGAVPIHPWTYEVLEMAAEMNRQVGRRIRYRRGPDAAAIGATASRAGHASPSAAGVPDGEAIELLRGQPRPFQASVGDDRPGRNSQGLCRRSRDRGIAQPRRALRHGQCRWRSCRLRTRRARDPHSRSAVA